MTLRTASRLRASRQRSTGAPSRPRTSAGRCAAWYRLDVRRAGVRALAPVPQGVGGHVRSVVHPQVPGGATPRSVTSRSSSLTVRSASNVAGDQHHERSRVSSSPMFSSFSVLPSAVWSNWNSQKDRTDPPGSGQQVTLPPHTIGPTGPASATRVLETPRVGQNAAAHPGYTRVGCCKLLGQTAGAEPSVCLRYW
jgi:hypothetical protein